MSRRLEDNARGFVAIEPDRDALRQVMAHYPTGATIVTVGFQGEPHGVAVNSFTSVSLDPPLVLFCPDKRSETWPIIRDVGKFAVNILAHGQRDLCKKFASKGVDRFDGANYTYSPLGCPVFDSSLAYLECALGNVHDEGDHYVAIGEVMRIGFSDGSVPLVFYQGGLHHFPATVDPAT